MPSSRSSAIALDPDAKAGTFSPGAPWALCITPGPNQVLYAADAYPGRIYKMTLDGQCARHDRRRRPAIEAVRLGARDRLPVGEHVLYVAELLNWRVQKLVLHPK